MKSCALLFLLAGLTAFAHADPVPSPRRLAITNVTVIGGVSDDPEPNMTVLIEGNRIVMITPAAKFTSPADTKLIDGSGKFLIPGLVDMHHHCGDGSLNPFVSPANIHRVLACGVTTIFSPGMAMPGFKALKQAAADPNAAFARFYSAGKVFSVRGGHDPSHGQASFYPETPDQARENVREMKAAGVDAIKFIIDSASDRRSQPYPVLDPDILKALIDEAHLQGLKAYGHAPQLRYAKQAMQSGADGLVHGIIDEPVDEEMIGLMRSNHAILITTLALYHNIADVPAFSRRLQAMDEFGVHTKATYDLFQREDTARALAERFGDKSAAEYTRLLPIARANVKKLWDSGILVASGTDTAVPGVLSGVSTQMELVLLVESGLKPIEAIRAATINGQRILGKEKELGSVEIGKTADLVILNADPLADIRNIRKVHLVIKNGNDFNPADLLVKKTTSGE